MRAPPPCSSQRSRSEHPPENHNAEGKPLRLGMAAAIFPVTRRRGAGLWRVAMSRTAKPTASSPCQT
jgi:hypothetical protein